MKGKCPACKRFVNKNEITVLLNNVHKKVGLKDWTCCIYCYSKWINKGKK